MGYDPRDQSMDPTDYRWREFGISVHSERQAPESYTVEFRQRSKQKTERRPGESTPRLNSPVAVVQVKWFGDEGIVTQFKQPAGVIQGFRQPDFEEKALERVKANIANAE